MTTETVQELIAQTDKLKSQWLNGLLTNDDYFTMLTRIVVIASSK